MVAHVAAYCTEEHLHTFREGIERFAGQFERTVQAQLHPSSQNFLDALPHGSPWDLIIVAAPGAEGMETVITAREAAPETPLLWCSDDAAFAVASYRLRCSLFLPLPLQPDQVRDAMARCLEIQ